MDTRKPLDGLAIGLMLLLAVTWGMQQITLKMAAADISPMMMIGLRSGIAALLVAGLLKLRGERLLARQMPWGGALAIGLLFGVEFVLLGEALRFTSAGHVVVFLYTGPIFAALGLHWKLPAERLMPLQWGGVLLAFGGIICAFLLRPSTGSSADSAAMMWGDFLSVLAGLSWGMTTAVIRTTRLSSLPAAQTLLYQLVVACVLLVPTALLLGQGAIHWTPVSMGTLFFQAVIVSFVSFLMWFWMLRHYLASRLGVFSFLTPLCGVLAGGWFLGESIEPSFLAGAGLVLAGILVVSGASRLKAAKARLA